MRMCEEAGVRPASDDGYLEVMTRAIFTAGLNWRVIDGKWPGFQQAFCDFAIDQVANLPPEEVDRLASDPTIVRNYRKIAATVENARRLKQLSTEHGSVGAYIDLLQSQGDDDLIATLSQHSGFLGPGTARSFLVATGHLAPDQSRLAGALR